ncbi:MAG: sugar phosphate isomerase/epimerase [Candidatus Margulisbacteria bacterium]|nr:sugar phosphate isomerase/epimerase [Candidatus Margulisiibacteriota bacterium]
MEYKIGLKLFTDNTSAISVAEQYYSERLFDYVELMVLPGADEENLGRWQKLKVPYLVHAPHGSYGFNLSNSKLRKQNKKMFSAAKRYADKLEAQFIIVHPGINGQVEETVRQIKALGDSRLIIENKPFISLRQRRCVGYSPAEIGSITKKSGAGFCLDVVHAVKAAYANGEDHFVFIRQFLALKPKVVHLCDCTLTGCFDEHLNFGMGELAIPAILSATNKAVPKVYLTLEVPEKSYARLTDFKKDRLLLRRYLKRKSL